MLGGLRALDAFSFELPAGLEDDDGPAESARERDLRERPPAATDGDDGLAGSDHGEIARMADTRRNDVVDPLVRICQALARQDADRRPTRRLRAAGCRGHHLAETTGDHSAAPPGQQAANLLGPDLVLLTTADYGHLGTGHEPRW